MRLVVLGGLGTISIMLIPLIMVSGAFFLRRAGMSLSFVGILCGVLVCLLTHSNVALGFFIFVLIVHAFFFLASLAAGPER